jgi:hypothetical protein
MSGVLRSLGCVANVTETQLRDYLQTFHDEYVESVERYLSEETRGLLLRYSLLPTHIVGYVST